MTVDIYHQRSHSSSRQHRHTGCCAACEQCVRVGYPLHKLQWPGRKMDLTRKRRVATKSRRSHWPMNLFREFGREGGKNRSSRQKTLDFLRPQCCALLECERFNLVAKSPGPCCRGFGSQPLSSPTKHKLQSEQRPCWLKPVGYGTMRRELSAGCITAR